MMTKTHILIASTIVVLVAIGIFYILSNDASNKADSKSPNDPINSSNGSSPGNPDPPTAPTDSVDFAITNAFNTAREKILENRSSHYAWGKLGMICIAHELMPEAIVSLKRAIELKPDYPAWHYCLALAIHDSNLQKALEHLEKSADLAKDSPPAPRLMLAEKLLELDKLNLAAKHIQIILDKNPTNGRALLAQGRLLYEKGDDRKAIAALERSLLNAPGRKRARLIMAKAYLRLGDEAMAEKIQKSAEPLRFRGWPDPYRSDINTHRTGLKRLLSQADIAMGYNRPKETIKLAEAATKDYPKSEQAWIMLGRGHLRLRHLEEAHAAFDTALKINPKSADTMFRKGVAFIYSKEFKKGELLYNKALKIKPDFTLAYFNLGQCLAKQDDLPGAIEALRNAIRFDPNLLRLRETLGDYLLAAKMPIKALEQYNEALSLKPDSQSVKHKIAQIKRETTKPKP